MDVPSELYELRSKVNELFDRFTPVFAPLPMLDHPERQGHLEYLKEWYSTALSQIDSVENEVEDYEWDDCDHDEALTEKAASYGELSEIVVDSDSLEKAIWRAKRGELSDALFYLTQAIPRLEPLNNLLSRRAA